MEARWILADFETQGAYELAKEFDPERKRTIGMQCFSFTTFAADHIHNDKVYSPSPTALLLGPNLAGFGS